MEQKRCYGCMKIKSQGSVCEHCGYDESISNDIHQLPAGTILKEQYLIGRVLGQGGFGITYLGWDLYLDVPVAVKEYYPSGMVMREVSVTMDVTKAVADIKAGKIEYRLDKTNIVHVPVGKASFTEEALQENFNALMDAIVKAKPSALKGQYLRSITLTSTMGPGVKVSVAKF